MRRSSPSAIARALDEAKAHCERRSADPADPCALVALIKELAEADGTSALAGVGPFSREASRATDTATSDRTPTFP